LHDHKVPDAKIKISAVKNAGNVLIKVTDNGPGIPAEISKTIFGPFVTKNKHNGTGLGLAIVKQYINAHGGNITVDNNNGAIFTITLVNHFILHK
jgi:two-component system NtrC family sensor kinase